ncbi:MAG: peptidyl-prolyl cis-trans isomerase [Agarilytica sp.]
MIKTLINKSYLVFLITLILVSCGKKIPEGQVLVTVNGSNITEYELEQTMRRTLRIENVEQVNHDLRSNILKTMVLSRVVLQSAEEKLDQKKKYELDIQAQAYREDLYLKAYLQQFSPPRPATVEMIRDFYDQNPERFGGGTVHSYEMLTGVTKSDGADSSKVMLALNNSAKALDWRQYMNQLLKQGVPVRYSQGESSDAILHERLRLAMQNMKVGDVSSVVLVDGKPYVIRIKDVKENVPEPLEKVSNEIRRALLPIQLKQSLETISNKLMNQSNIHYKDPEFQ